MLRLQMFGGLALLDHSGTLVIHQRLRLGLLAVLALAGEQGLSRDRLRLLFWPDSSDASARHTLDQLLYALRRQVGDDALLGTDPLRLNPAVITSDVRDFETAIARGDHAAAIAMYRGPFADGFYIRETADFERWTEQQRVRLAAEYRNALGTLAAHMSRTGHVSEEIALRRTLVEQDPLNESATADLVRALALAGDRGEALRHARLYQRLVENELGIAPNPAILALATAIMPTRAVVGADPPGATTPPALGQPWPSRVRQRMSAPRSTVALVLAGSMLILLGVLIERTMRAEGAGPAAGSAFATLVAPFRVSGADSSLHYLAEGMIDLLAVTLTGEGGPRAVDPRTTMSSWRTLRARAGGEPTVAEIMQAARALGAVQLVLGEVVGEPDHLIVSASVVRVADGRTVTRARVEGPQDSLRALVDGLAAHVLTSDDSKRSATELSASLPALRAYLQGESAYRAGRYEEAVASFQRAVARDAQFAVAALGLAMSVGWTPSLEDDEPGIRLAWSLRDRLSAKDRALLHARVDRPFSPASSTRDKLAEKELATRLAPDRADAWFWLGDDLYHEGTFIGDTGARARSRILFQRSLELDSVSAPLGHLVELAAMSGDTVATAHLAGVFLRHDSTSDRADFIRWRSALARGDERALARLRRRYGEMKTTSLLHMLAAMQYDAVGLGDADRVVAALRDRSLTRAEQRAVWMAIWELELNRGRPMAALVASRMWRAIPSDGGSADREYDERIIGDALFAGGDSAAAEMSVRLLAGNRAASSLCASHLWQVAHGDVRLTSSVIASLRAIAAHHDSAAVSSQSALCAATLAVMLESSGARQVRHSAVPHLDSLLRTGPVAFPVMSAAGGNVAVVGALLARGDTGAALAASRRRLYGRSPLRMLAVLLVHDARLSLLTGDTAGAVRAYRHYLALHDRAEPSRRPPVAEMRAELAGILATR